MPRITAKTATVAPATSAKGKANKPTPATAKANKAATNVVASNAAPASNVVANAAASGELKHGQGIYREFDMPWCEKKGKIFAALIALKATNAATAQSSKAVADAAGVTERDVRHYCYAAACKGVEATGVHSVEGMRGYGFSITPAGVAMLKNPPVKASKPKPAATPATQPATTPVVVPKASKPAKPAAKANKPAAKPSKAAK